MKPEWSLTVGLLRDHFSIVGANDSCIDVAAIAMYIRQLVPVTLMRSYMEGGFIVELYESVESVLT